jgi:hypothetical protein
MAPLPIADLVGLAVVVAVNAAAAALGTRVLRVRLSTVWGTAIYVAVLVPFVQVAATLVLTGPLGLGPDLGSPLGVLAATVALPLALGVAFDLFWMPAPDEVEVPDTFREA